MSIHGYPQLYHDQNVDTKRGQREIEGRGTLLYRPT